MNPKAPILPEQPNDPLGSRMIFRTNPSKESLYDKARASIAKIQATPAPPSHAPNPGVTTLLSVEQQQTIKTPITKGLQSTPITERISKNVIVFTMTAADWLMIALVTGKADEQATQAAGIVSNHPEIIDEFGYVTLQRNTNHHRRTLTWLIPTKSTVKELRRRRREEARAQTA